MAKMQMPLFTEAFRAMGTEVSVDIVLPEQVAPGQAREAVEKIKNIFAKNEKIFSRFSLDSELNKINRNLGQEIEVSPEMLEVLRLCLKFYEISGGYFDPRVIGNLEKIGYDKDFRSNNLNTATDKEIELEKFFTPLADDLQIQPDTRTVVAKKRIDTTGIAKGYTVDEAALFLRQNGYQNFVVDAGGDMHVAGRNNEGLPWRVAVEGVAEERLMLELSEAGVATSGIDRKRWSVGGKKYHHLINPKDPENFSYEIKTVSVIETKAVEADGRAKVLVLLGKEKGMEFANRHNIKALFLDYRGNIYLSEAIKGFIA